MIFYLYLVVLKQFINYSNLKMILFEFYKKYITSVALFLERF